MNAEKYVVVGEVSKPHGVRGELCIHCHAQSPSLFESVERVRLTPRAQAASSLAGDGSRDGKQPGRGRSRRPQRITSVWKKVIAFRPHQDRALLTLEGVSDRDAAEALRGWLIEVEASSLPRLSEDEIFLHELMGLRVRESGAADDAEDLGVLEDVLDEAGQELWVIRSPDGREILLPAVAEFVEVIDLDEGLAVICPPPGLLELFEEEPKGGDDAADGGLSEPGAPGEPGDPGAPGESSPGRND